MPPRGKTKRKRRSWPRPKLEGVYAAVMEMAETEMKKQDYSRTMIKAALRLWGDFLERDPVRIQKPERYAATLEYIIVHLHGLMYICQYDVGPRYGVPAQSICQVNCRIARALDLRFFDKRYFTGRRRTFVWDKDPTDDEPEEYNPWKLAEKYGWD